MDQLCLCGPMVQHKTHLFKKLLVFLVAKQVDTGLDDHLGHVKSTTHDCGANTPHLLQQVFHFALCDLCMQESLGGWVGVDSKTNRQGSERAITANK